MNVRLQGNCVAVGSLKRNKTHLKCLMCNSYRCVANDYLLGLSLVLISQLPQNESSDLGILTKIKIGHLRDFFCHAVVTYIYVATDLLISCNLCLT